MLTPLEEELLKHLNNLFKINEKDHYCDHWHCDCNICIEKKNVKETLNRLSPETDIEQWRRLAG